MGHEFASERSDRKTIAAVDGLRESDLDPDPFRQFARWYREAEEAAVRTPEAMALATATADGVPSVRMVLLKGFSERGLVFYTNALSRKGEEMADNPRAALLLYWEPLHRQLRVEGTVAPASREETERYFHSRPRDSQASAAVSRQSSIVANRDSLDRAAERFLAQHAGDELPLPDEWSGFRVTPASFEFWQGRTNRLHDRLRYRLLDGRWIVERLAP